MIKLKESEKISWIFMAIAMASETAPIDFNGILIVADGINHSVPTNKEMQTSIAWLLAKGLVTKKGKKYTLTIKGKSEYEIASEKTNKLLTIWGHLEVKLKAYS